jgi:beta-glucosidase
MTPQARNEVTPASATERPGANVPYRNPALPVAERVADLLSRMTLEEKVAQMMGVWRQRKTVLLDEDGNLDPARARTHLPDGIGQIARLSDVRPGLRPADMAALSNAIQKYFVEETRLGIPVIFHEECLHGLAAFDATSYPQPIGLASTFNPSLVEEVYTAIAEDTRSRGAQQALTPVADVAREPRWGRVEETFGEDPHLVSQMAQAAVRGFQGDATFTDDTRVIATMKHFAAHGQPEAGTNCGPVNVSERELRDVFLAPFRDCILRAGALSVMASYNEIDGIPSHANTWLLRDVLRREWGFSGIVVSDYFAITELHDRDESTGHWLAHDRREAASLALAAGVNIELPDPDCYPELRALVRDRAVDVAVLDGLVGPLLDLKFRLGLFDRPYVEVRPAFHEQKLLQERGLALRAAQQTMVLLKNDGGALPLAARAGSTIAVIGPNADRKMLGGYSGEPRYYTTVLQGITERAGKDVKVLYSEGCKITVGGSWNEDTVTPSDPDQDRAAIAEAVTVAKQADVVVLAIGGNEQTSREGWGKTHLGDRPDLTLYGRQQELLSAMAATGKPVIVLLFNGRPKVIGEIQQQARAVIECWYLGQETGQAIASVLFGDCNPSGKLPISFPRSSGHLPCYYNHKPSARRGYLFDDVTSLFPFGFGLSYTTFAVGAPVLAKNDIAANESTTVTVEVTNTGTSEGAEVVQLYIRDLVSSVTRPVKELKAFTRVSLRPGETRNVTFTLGPDQLLFTNVRKERVVEPGEFAIMAGTSSRDVDLKKAMLRVH